LGAVRQWMQWGNLRRTLRNQQRVGGSGHLYGARERAESRDGDGNRDVCSRHYKNGDGDNHRGCSATGQRNDNAKARRVGAGASLDVHGDGDQRCRWGGRDAFSGQTATTATYVAPASPGSITVTATSVADTTKNATATIGVTDLAGVTTYHNDLSRDGANVQEYALNTTNVTSATFGKLFSCTVDGAVYAQPLWVPNVNIGGGTHNVIVVATMRDSVYVLDADTNPCQTYWKQTLIPTGETYGNNSDVVSADIFPDIGILGTPVIDPATNIIYLVTKTKTSSTNYIQRLHALNLLTGAEQTNSPVVISASVAGNCEGGTTILFNALTENQRPGLALSNGIVYVAWASHGDNGM
jgi:hypothetical protein